MTVFVTGATGFIGSHLCKHLTGHGQRVISLIHNCPIWTDWLKEALKPTIRVRGDIRDYHLLMRVLNKYEVDKVFHLAAQSIVKHAYKNPIGTCEINIMGTVKLLEACRQVGVEKVIVQSTDKVYGNQTSVSEDARLIPTEPYGSSKICTDVMARSYVKTYGMPISVTRCCNVYGYDWDNDRIIPNTVKACLQGKSPIIFKDDKSQRQYVFIDDVVEILIELMETEESKVINIASDDILNQKEVVLKILDFFPELKPKYVEKPEITEIKSQSMLRSYPMKFTPFKEGLKHTINKFRKYGW